MTNDFALSARRKALGLAAAMTLTALGVSDAYALDGSWVATPSNGNWITAPGETNWFNVNNASNDGFYPGSTTTPNVDRATFLGNSTITNIAINSTAGYTGPLYIGSIGFQGNDLTNNYVIGSPTGNPLVVPSNPNATTATFQMFISGASRPAPTASVTETIAAPIVISPVAATTTGFYTLQNNNTALNSGDVLRFTGPITGAVGNTATTLTLRGNNLNAATAVTSNITDGVNAGTMNLTKVDAGIWTLSGNNTYTGQTAVSGGTLVLSGNNTFNPSAAGSAPLIVTGGGTLSISNFTGNIGGLQRINLGGGFSTGRLLYTGPAVTTAVVVGSTAFNAGTGIIIDQSGSGVLRFTSNLDQRAVAQTVTFQGSTAGTGEFAGLINDAGGFALSLAKSGTGTWTLDNAANGYTGVTTLGGGVLRVATLANGGTASSIGAANNLLLSGGSLQYVGAATATDRGLSIGAAGGTLDSSGTGEVAFTGTAPTIAVDPPISATFNNASTTVTLPAGSIGGVVVGQTITAFGIPAGATITAINYSNNTVLISAATTSAGGSDNPITFGPTGTRTLTLTGTNAGANSLAAAIGNAATSGVVAVAKTGTGTWALTGANTYTGGTTVSGGTLSVTTAAATPLLTAGATPTTGGTDIQNGGVTFVGGSAATIRGLLQASFQDANTPGVMDTGTLRSSTSTARRGLGYRDSGAGSVIVRAALFGDVNLDGGVLIGDFNVFAPNFGSPSGKVWADGDFNYDGAVNIGDFNLLAVNFGTSLPPAADWAPLIAFAAAHNDLAEFASLTGVPEPTSLGLFAAGLTLGLRRRRLVEKAC